MRPRSPARGSTASRLAATRTSSKRRSITRAASSPIPTRTTRGSTARRWTTTTSWRRARGRTGPTQGLHTQVNTPDPWDGQYPTDRKNDVKWVDDDPASTNDGDLKDMATADRKPCSAMMLDVKMTETDIAGRFSPLRFLDVLGFVDFIDARARVELRRWWRRPTCCRSAVEDLNPKRVHVWLYDEDTQELLGDAELEPRAPEDGLLMYDNSVAGGGTPITVNLDRETSTART